LYDVYDVCMMCLMCMMCQISGLHLHPSQHIIFCTVFCVMLCRQKRPLSSTQQSILVTLRDRQCKRKLEPPPPPPPEDNNAMAMLGTPVEEIMSVQEKMNNSIRHRHAPRMTKFRRRTLSVSLSLLLICCTWLAQSLVPMPLVQRSATHQGLLYSQYNEGEIPLSEPELIESIKLARTAKAIDQTLRGAKDEPLNGSTVPVNNQLQERTDFAKRNHSDLTSETSPTKSDTGQKSFEKLSLNVTAAALRRVAHVSIQESRRKQTDPSGLEIRKALLTNLLENIGGQIVLAHRSNDPSETVGMYALADVLEALAILSKRVNNGRAHMQPMARLVVGLMLRHENEKIYHLGPIRLVQCLQSLAALNLNNDDDRWLRHTIYERLAKPDAVSKLPARSLSYGLSALAASKDDLGDNAITFKLSKSFMRRLRKQKVRETASVSDLCRALVASRDLVVSKHASAEEISEEASIFGFTTIRAILDMNKKERVIYSSQMADIVSSWASLRKVDPSREDTLIDGLLDVCEHADMLSMCTVWQLQNILEGMEKLQVTNRPELVRLAGEQLVEIVEQRCSLGSMNPTAVNSILRCPVLLHRRNATVIGPYIQASVHLFADSDFLGRTRVGELANFLWFMSMARWYHNGSLKALTERIMETEVADSCTPKLASRILGTFTSIVSAQSTRSLNKGNGLPEAAEMQELSSNLFHDLGGHLLSSQMSPAEVSSALYAYAKASYVQDMGIYDHLVSQIASMSSQCSVRQLAQSLWSCGKMVAWEDNQTENEDESCKPTQDPPYLQNAKHLATVLSTRMKELTPMDVTQCMWAVGRLRITDARLVCAFAYRAKQLALKLNSAEVANIVWALSRVNFDDEEVLKTLTNRITSDSLQPMPQDAATVLYALGILQHKDERAFTLLSNKILEQIDRTSAQSIANTLWAHRAVRIPPPQRLLDSWATQKLGIVGIQPGDV
jgi:hypothetical protein